MRRAFRPHPRIRADIWHDGDYIPDFTLSDEINITYSRKENVITLIGCTEKMILRNLMHELDHWAMEGFLSISELRDAYVNQGGLDSFWLFEWTADLQAEGGMIE